MNPPPPPPPPRNRNLGNSNTAYTASTQSSFTAAPPPPPPSNVYTATQTYEPYGEIAASSSSGISKRRSVNDGQTIGTSHGYTYGSSGSSGRYAMPPSSYGTPTPKTEKRVNTTRAKLEYQHNVKSMMALFPSLASILWWHESSVIIQIFLFMALILYGLDLMNARDALAVVIWNAAFVLSIASGIGSLLLLDDNDAAGGSMVLALLQLGVESMFFCCMVSLFVCVCMCVCVCVAFDAKIKYLTPNVLL